MNEHQQPHKKTAGEFLKEVRVSKGIPLETVHEHIKIPLDVLRAIEEGYTVRTLSPFYLKGFIKMYAQHLGVDVGRLLDNGDEKHCLKKKTTPPPAAPRKISLPDPSDEVMEKINAFFSPRRRKKIFQTLSVIFVIFVVFKIGGCLRHKKSEAPVQEKTAVAHPKKATKKKNPPLKENSPDQKKTQEAKKQTPSEAPAAAPSVIAPPGGKETTAVPAQPVKEEEKKQEESFELTIVAQQNGWLQVKVDGNVVFQSTMRQGMKEIWKAKKQIEISGRSIHYLDYLLDGKSVKGPSSVDANARRIVIMKSGMMVKK